MRFLYRLPLPAGWLAAHQYGQSSHAGARTPEWRLLHASFPVLTSPAFKPLLGQALYEENEVFAAAMRECESIAEAEAMLPRPLLEVLYPAPHEEEECAALLQTPLFTMPALFAVEYALLAMFDGCEPYGVVGHSIGEYVAAVAAGVFDLPVAMALVCERGRTMEGSPLGGSMISLMADAATAEAAIAAQGLGERVSIAAYNGPQSVVIGGTDGDLAAVLGSLPDDIKSTRVRASHPDHTALMEPVAVAVGKRCEELLAGRPPAASRCLWATSVADWPMGEMGEIGRPEYWRRGIVGGVDFPRAMAAVVRAYADDVAASGGAAMPLDVGGAAMDVGGAAMDVGGAAMDVGGAAMDVGGAAGAGTTGTGAAGAGAGALACSDEGSAEGWAETSGQRTLRFIELGEGMLVRFCQNLRCISDADAELGREIEFEMAFSHLLPRKAGKDRAADAREAAKAIEEVKAAASARSVRSVPPQAQDCDTVGPSDAIRRGREPPRDQQQDVEQQSQLDELGCRKGRRGTWSRGRPL